SGDRPMLSKLRPRFSPTTRFLFGLAGILALLLVVVAFWWLLPVRPRVALPALHGPCRQIRIAGNGRILLALYEDALVVWNLASLHEQGVVPFPEPPDPWPQILLAPDGQKLTLTYPHGSDQVRLWCPDTQKTPIPLPGSHHGGFSRDSRTLVVWHAFENFKLW